MSTTSTLVTVKDQLVTKFTTALATSSRTGGQVSVTYAWPGPDTDEESVFIGYHPQIQATVIEIEQEIPNIKAGRKQRQETYRIPVTIWEFYPEADASEARDPEAQAFAVLGDLEDELADDPLIGLSSATIHLSSSHGIQSTLAPFGSGWVCELVFTIEVQARLT